MKSENAMLYLPINQMPKSSSWSVVGDTTEWKKLERYAQGLHSGTTIGITIAHVSVVGQNWQVYRVQDVPNSLPLSTIGVGY